MYAWEVVSVNFFIVRKPKTKKPSQKTKIFFSGFCGFVPFYVLWFVGHYCGLTA
jgi:hypothetical protein